ncbi:hypothetical protein [Nesterenkonia pannonica]|uniref:hypothetical protein n=1 Tax=Nesterenkonia pannonica TaxID=1548602 RepID=UPI00216438D0|nr:hypothetical protein [Nesterenkonia pannonica]
MTRRGLVGAGLAALGALVLTGCDQVLEADAIEEALHSDYAEMGYSQDEYTMTCTDVDAEEGASEECTVHFEDLAETDIWEITIVDVNEETDEVEYQAELTETRTGEDAE